VDRPEHRQRRTLVSKAFTVRRIEGVWPRRGDWAFHYYNPPQPIPQRCIQVGMLRLYEEWVRIDTWRPGETRDTPTMCGNSIGGAGSVGSRQAIDV
jgi:hypothetical protein